MSVYVDDMSAEFGRMKMCHMIADSPEELFRMAFLIGVSIKHAQNRGNYREHFDICKSKRIKAVMFGAIEITQKELGRLLHQRKPKETNG